MGKGISINRVTLLGHVVSDPDIRETTGGHVVATLRLATNKRGKKGEPEKTEYHRLVAWNSTAELIEKYVKKGKQLYIEGNLQTREWTKGKDSEGNDIKHYTTEIQIDRMEFGPNEESGRGEGPQRGRGASPERSAAPGREAPPARVPSGGGRPGFEDESSAQPDPRDDPNHPEHMWGGDKKAESGRLSGGGGASKIEEEEIPF